MRIRLAALSILLFSHDAGAVRTVPMFVVDSKGVGVSAGHVSISQSKYGLVFSPSLKGLSPGMHGFHLHQNPSCNPGSKDGKMMAALAAGDHYDPRGSKRHGTPWGNGHMGDLPAIFVDAKGNANQPVLAPRLKTADLSGRSLVAHIGGDNHADYPAPLGGGGARMACGVIK